MQSILSCWSGLILKIHLRGSSVPEVRKTRLGVCRSGDPDGELAVPLRVADSLARSASGRAARLLAGWWVSPGRSKPTIAWCWAETGSLIA